MLIIAEKRTLEMSEGNMETTKTLFDVDPGETVEALLSRIGMTGKCGWHYDQTEVRLKLAHPRIKPEKGGG